MNKSMTPFGSAAALVCSAFLAAGCASTSKPAAGATAEGGINGGRLWAQNCARCHNARTPSDYSTEQWNVAMLHMRVRAGLTPEEQKAVFDFLKSAN